MNSEDFKILFHKNYNSLCNYAATIIKNAEASEDLVQEVFVDFWKRHDGKQIDFKPENYIVRAVKYKCIDYLRKQSVHRAFVSETEISGTEMASEELSANHELDLNLVIKLAVDELPEKTKEVFILSKIKKLSYKETAEKLGISEKTVENQMSRAFKHLRVKLKDFRFYLLLLFFFLNE